MTSEIGALSAHVAIARRLGEIHAQLDLAADAARQLKQLNGFGHRGDQAVVRAVPSQALPLLRTFNFHQLETHAFITGVLKDYQGDLSAAAAGPLHGALLTMRLGTTARTFAEGHIESTERHRIPDTDYILNSVKRTKRQIHESTKALGSFVDGSASIAEIAALRARAAAESEAMMVTARANAAARLRETADDYRGNREALLELESGPQPPMIGDAA